MDRRSAADEQKRSAASAPNRLSAGIAAPASRRMAVCGLLALAGCAGLPDGDATIHPPDQKALSEQWMMTNDPHHPWEFYPQLPPG